MATQKLANFGSIGRRALAQEMVERHQDAGGAEAALQRVMSPERGLQRAQAVSRRREAFDCADIAAVDLYGKRQASTGQHAIDSDSASPANAVFATDMDARRPDILAKKIRRQQPRLGFPVHGPAVQPEADRVASVRWQTCH
jgi:hypothetical protein